MFFGSSAALDLLAILLSVFHHDLAQLLQPVNIPGVTANNVQEPSANKWPNGGLRLRRTFGCPRGRSHRKAFVIPKIRGELAANEGRSYVLIQSFYRSRRKFGGIFVVPLDPRGSMGWGLKNF